MTSSHGSDVKQTVLLFSLLFLLVTDGPGLVQAAGCGFNIIGTWQSKTAGKANDIFLRLAPNGDATVLSRSGSPRKHALRPIAKGKYSTDDPRAPTLIEFKMAEGVRNYLGSEVAKEIVSFDERRFVTVDPISGRSEWVRVEVRRYFITFAARAGDPGDNGAAMVMWTTVDRRQTQSGALGLYVIRGDLTLGRVPSNLCDELVEGRETESSVMLRIELTSEEFERTRQVWRKWDGRIRSGTLRYSIPYLNSIVFLERVVESLNHCGERIKADKMDWSSSDELAAGHNLPQIPFQYVKKLRRLNNAQHTSDEIFPGARQPIPLQPGR